jgi:hypothetical protein
VDRWHTYTPILIAAGVLPVVATAALFWLAGPVRKVELEERS